YCGCGRGRSGLEGDGALLLRADVASARRAATRIRRLDAGADLWRHEATREGPRAAALAPSGLNQLELGPRIAHQLDRAPAAARFDLVHEFRIEGEEQIVLLAAELDLGYVSARHLHPEALLQQHTVPRSAGNFVGDLKRCVALPNGRDLLHE